MTGKNIFLIALILCFGLVNTQPTYKKIVNTLDPQAKCLDGSPPAFYIHEGTEKDKFLLYFLGGGLCAAPTLAMTLDSCYARSKTELGSTLPWPSTFSQTQGYLSLSEPTYTNWTKVIFLYCDGAMHQGQTKAPIKYKDRQLYFRGGRITRSNFKLLMDSYNLGKASKILLTGSSAGAIATFSWSNYLQSLLPNPSIVFSVPDSGIFINVPTAKQNYPLMQVSIKNLFSVAFVDQKTAVTECNQHYNEGYEWKCIFIQYAVNWLKGKYLFVNSIYDQWAISNILQISCLTKGISGETLKNCSQEDINYIQIYRQKYIDLINTINIRKDQIGFWCIACSTHVYAAYNNMYNVQQQRVPQKNGLTVKEAIQRFVIDQKSVLIWDQRPWPSNAPCSV